jgi:type I restriction enzyme S subunit
LPNKLKDSYLNVFEETQYSDLPTKWVYAPLVNLGKIQGGGTPSKSNLNYWKGNIPWISPKDMKVDRISSGRYFISKNALDSSSANLIPQKSILFVIRGMILAHTFPVAITQNEVTINQDMKGITPCSATNPEYLFLVFKSIQGNVLSYIREATHGTLRLEMLLLQTFAFPLPPIEEQNEIIRQVDKLFALADKLESHYQKAKTHVDKLSQSILAKAFRGELAPQDPNDESAEKLLERIIAEKAKMEGGIKKAGGRKKETK